MSIQERLDTELKTAMRARDKRMSSLVRMLKSKMTETTTKAGFKGEVNDALWLNVIGAYAKSLKKALGQFAAAGEAGAEHVEQLTWEVGVLESYLPAKADEATVRGWVQAAIDGLGGKGAANLGAVMGAVMKSHKADVDASMVRSIVAELLA
jgi:uncharacterized protein